jgi:hypothetical protein
MKRWKEWSIGLIILTFLILLIAGARWMNQPRKQIIPKSLDSSGEWVREWKLKKNLSEGVVFGRGWLFLEESWLRAYDLQGSLLFERQISMQDDWSVSERRLYIYNRSTGNIECLSPTYESLWAISFMRPIESVFSYEGLLAVSAKSGQTSEQLMILDPQGGQVLANLSSPNTTLLLANRAETGYFVSGVQMKDGYWRNYILHFDQAGNLLDDLKVNEPVLLATRMLDEQTMLIVSQGSLALYQRESIMKRIELDVYPKAVEIQEMGIDCLLADESHGELIRFDQELNRVKQLDGLPSFTHLVLYQGYYYLWNEEEWGMVEMESMTYIPGTKLEERIVALVPVDGELWLVHEYGIDLLYWRKEA